MKKTAFALMGAVLLIGASGLAADGAALYKSKMCGACHGPGKKGGDLKDSKMDKAAMVKFLKDPKAVKPGSTMPGVKGSDEEIGAIADYVMSLRK